MDSGPLASDKSKLPSNVDFGTLASRDFGGTFRVDADVDSDDEQEKFSNLRLDVEVGLVSLDAVRHASPRAVRSLLIRSWFASRALLRPQDDDDDDTDQVAALDADEHSPEILSRPTDAGRANATAVDESLAPPTLAMQKLQNRAKSSVARRATVDYGAVAARPLAGVQPRVRACCGEPGLEASALPCPCA